jgi:methyl-accepting chemotaxis protein
MNNWIGNLNLSKKLLVSPVIVLFLIVIVGLISLRTMSNQQSALDDIYNIQIKNTLAADNNYQTVTEVQENIYKFISWARAGYDQNKLNELSHNQLESLDKTIETIKSLIKNDPNNKFIQLNKLSLQEVTDYRKAVADVIDFASFDLNTATMSMGTVEDKYDVLEKTLNGIRTNNTIDMDSSYNEANSNYHDMIKIFIVLILFSFVLSIIITGKVNSAISKPIKLLDNAAVQVSLGDLSINFDIKSKDEIGTLASSFKKMITNVKDTNDLLTHEKQGIEEKVLLATKEITDQKEYLNSSVNKILSVMKDFANGDLSVHLQADTDDDIGKLFKGFNLAVANIREAMENVASNINSTVNASQKISGSTEEMAAGAQEQNNQTTEVAGAVEEMTRTILETTKNSSLAAEAAKKAGAIAKEGGSVVAETINGMNRIAKVVRKSADTVHELGKSSDQIGEIIQVIDDIADQTNLLALNAAIEAARAGEQGRGFAVVADEVRKLAERTTKATKEIASMIKQIQKDTAGAVDSMEEGTNEVEKGKELADKAGESLNQIIEGAEQVVDIITQVAAASEEQSATSEQISKSIEAISNVTQESAGGIHEIAKASEDLSRLTLNLQGLIAKFNTGKEFKNIILNNNLSKSQFSVRSNGNIIKS